MSTVTAARIEVLAAALRAVVASLPPTAAAAALATLRAEVENLPDAPDDADAARVGELAPLLARA